MTWKRQNELKAVSLCLYVLSVLSKEGVLYLTILKNGEAEKIDLELAGGLIRGLRVVMEPLVISASKGEPKFLQRICFVSSLFRGQLAVDHTSSPPQTLILRLLSLNHWVVPFSPIETLTMKMMYQMKMHASPFVSELVARCALGQIVYSYMSE